MPEEDNSILGESVYQHLRYSEERNTPSQTQAQSHRVDLKMFEQQQEQMNSLGRPGYTREELEDAVRMDSEDGEAGDCPPDTELPDHHPPGPGGHQAP